MVHLGGMKQKFLALSKVIGFICFYFLVFVAAIFFTMSFLIKGDEISAPNFVGKSLDQAYQTASQNGIFLKKIKGNYIKNYDPLTIVGQIPVTGTKVKKNSYIKVFVTPERVEVIVPDITGYNLKKSVEILEMNGLRKGYVSYLDSADIPVDFTISQSYPANSRVAKGTEIDVLVCGSKKSNAFIMPDVIGKQIQYVVNFFRGKGFKVTQITEVEYDQRMDSGIIIQQTPSPGFRINSRNLVSFEVNK